MKKATELGEHDNLRDNEIKRIDVYEPPNYPLHLSSEKISII